MAPTDGPASRPLLLHILGRRLAGWLPSWASYFCHSCGLVCSERAPLGRRAVSFFSGLRLGSALSALGETRNRSSYRPVASCSSTSDPPAGPCRAGPNIVATSSIVVALIVSGYHLASWPARSRRVLASCGVHVSRRLFRGRPAKRRANWPNKLLPPALSLASSLCQSVRPGELSLLAKRLGRLHPEASRWPDAGELRRARAISRRPHLCDLQTRDLDDDELRPASLI